MEVAIFAATPAIHTQHRQHVERVKRAMNHASASLHTFTYRGTVGEGGWGEVVNAYNEAIEYGLYFPCSHFWFVEADVLVPEHALTTLLTHDIPVVAGIIPYHKIAPEYEDLVVAGTFINGGLKTVNFHLSEVRDQIVKGDIWAGTGCFLVKREVFERGIRFQHQPERASFELLFWRQIHREGFTSCIDGNVICEDLG